MPKVRTTILPDTELEVSDSELLDLERQGLIADEPKSSSKASDKKGE